MNRPRVTVLPGALVLVLLGVVLSWNLVWITGNLDLLRPVTRGRAAPGFTLSDSEGNEVKLASLRGKVVVLSFWATWCKPCVRKMPALEAMATELGPRGLEVLGVNVEGEADRVSDFVQRTGHGKPGAGGGHFRLVLDDGSVAGRYGVQTLPHTVLVGADGAVKHVMIGGGNSTELKRRAEAELPPVEASP